MAATYAMPTVHVGHAGHGHSHSRKLAMQRLPLQPTSLNGGYQFNGASAVPSPLKSHEPLQHQPQKSVDVSRETMQREQPPAHLDLPPPHPSFSTPTNARSKSTERRKSVGLPTHLRLHGSGYGFPASSSPRYSSNDSGSGAKWITVKEVIASILVPLPCVLASLAFGLGAIPQRPSTRAMDEMLANKVLEEAIFKGGQSYRQISGGTLACVLTSFSLVLVGARGKLGQISGSLDRRKTSLVPGNDAGHKRWSDTARRVAARILTVGLPFYATSKLGGLRVATVILVALASDTMTTEGKSRDLSTTRGWTRLLKFRRWTIVSILIQVLCDLTGGTNRLTSVDVCLGYMALALAIFALPPSFPSSKPKASSVTSSAPASESSTSTVLTTPWETPPAVDTKKVIAAAVSPMIYTAEDIDLTLYSGALLGIFSLLLFIATGPSAGATSRNVQLTWGLLSACAAASALITTEIKSLRSRGALGFVLGSLGSCLLLSKLHDDSWRGFAYQSLLIGLSFVGKFLDTHPASPISHSTHIHQHHAKLKAAENGQYSRFSGVMLHNVQRWPLLHSIIAEKDSRRIFYFMW